MASLVDRLHRLLHRPGRRSLSKQVRRQRDQLRDLQVQFAGDLAQLSADPRLRAQLEQALVGSASWLQLAHEQLDPLLPRIFSDARRSHAQLFQDLWVLHELNDLEGGFFVEFGATDGVELSNTLLLEREYGWRGILAEPNPCWRQALAANRSCAISFDCVWRTTGERIPFQTVPGAEVLAGATEFADRDFNSRSRTDGPVVEVSTVSLEDLLARHQAPERIDYLSVDTEGSELDILRGFDFERHDVHLISVEHNHSVAREPIQALLEGHGYQRVHESLSRWDDWYRRG